MKIVRAVILLILVLVLVYFSIGALKIKTVASVVAIILFASIFIGIISRLAGKAGTRSK